MEAFGCRPRGSSARLEDIEENSPAANWVPPLGCIPPETPTESMEFLARSWSLSALELSKAIGETRLHSNAPPAEDVPFEDHMEFTTAVSAEKTDIQSQLQQSSKTYQHLPLEPRAETTPMEDEETKELYLLQQALNPDFLANQHLLRNGLYKGVLKGKTVGRWLKDQKEKRKQEIRTHNAQLHGAITVAGVAAAVAVIAAATATASASQYDEPSKISAALASAAALVASHCVEIAEEMGAEHDQILTTVTSAVNVKTAGDIMTLTAGAATALRGAATLNSRLRKGSQTAALDPNEEQVQDGKDLEISSALNFILKGGELLKRTRKGSLHWKQVSFRLNSNWQVIATMKSKHIVGAFTKKKKCLVLGVYSDIPLWPARNSEEDDEQRAYFGIKTADRLIEFECKNQSEKQMWTDGIRQMLLRHTNII